MPKYSLLVGSIILLLLTGISNAETVMFDLENIAFDGGTGSWKTTSTVDVGTGPVDITLDIGYFPFGFNSILDVADLSAPLGGVWGNRSLSFFSGPGIDEADADRISFTPDLGALTGSFGVSEIGWDMGDVAGTDQDLWSLVTFNLDGSLGISTDIPQGTGGRILEEEFTGTTYLGPLSDFFTSTGSEGFAYTSEFQRQSAGIGQALLMAGSMEFRNSVYIDNITLKLGEFVLGKVGTSDAPNTDAGGSGNPGGSTGPATGSGQFAPAGVVPLPTAVSIGLSMLGILGLGRLLHRRRND